MCVLMESMCRRSACLGMCGRRSTGVVDRGGFKLPVSYPFARVAVAIPITSL